MLERHTFRLWSLLLTAAAGGAAVAATPAPRDLPRHLVAPGLDGAPVVLQNPVDGRIWAAWAFRARGEFDLALSVRDARGVWSSPVFIGQLDGLDEGEPAMTPDPWGNIYLAIAVRQTGRILLSVLPTGTNEWSLPVEVAGSGVPGRASRPALRVVGDRLVVAYRQGGSTVIRDLPLFLPSIGLRGVQDGADGIPPAGATGPTPLGGGSAPKP